MKAVLDFVGAAGEYGEKRQDEYIRMFEDCSWEYLMNFGGLYIFKKTGNYDGAGRRDIL